MEESDNDIEFLDEDADIVQQCVQVQGVQQYLPADVEVKLAPLAPLLVERQPAQKRRKKKIDEDDSDYDPSQDLVLPSPPSQRGKKRRQPAKVNNQFVNKKVKTNQKEVVSKVSNVKVGKVGKGDAVVKRAKVFPPLEVEIDRKKFNIRIPDYDDPLCLPVKAIKQGESDIKRLNNWNNVCLQHFKHCDNLLKPERGETHSSNRTVVFRNVVNKQSDKIETTIWSKTCVENVDGDRKSEIFQCVLPRYKEKKVLTNFAIGNRKQKLYHISDEVILSKEDNKDGEVLVAYKPKDNLSAVYKLVTPHDKRESKDETEEKDDEENKMYMKELLCCKMCTPCFQASWRGVRKTDKKSISCPICNCSSFVTVHNLLTHLKSHSTEDMKKFKFVISNILAEIMDYHYKCRVCREQFNSIKQLRQHVNTHQGRETFMCEVGNHLAK